MLKDTFVLKDILVLHTHLCYRHTCVKRHPCRTDTLVLKTHLCYRHICVKRQACVTDTLVLQIHLCYRYTWVTHVSVAYKLVLDIIDMLQTCLSHRHVCTLIHVNNHCQVMQTISQVVLTPLVIIIIIMFVNIALFK